MGGCCASELGHPLTEFESGHVASLPRQFVVRLDGIGNEGLGLEVDIGDDVTASITKVLSDGAIPAWNQRNARELAVQAGDHIVEVNGIRGSAKEIIANIKGGAELSVVRHGRWSFWRRSEKKRSPTASGWTLATPTSARRCWSAR
ncbi:unnamed protein product [Prorocentrum cordatum]|uniref:PDZ domain-containing protein n=1 Tax=Prorocentrum cordatum TaxID=2364126 RepID=A0ABN9SDX3_9DINO|nr:unnamed protein product [Polarella glacialis]